MAAVFDWHVNLVLQAQIAAHAASQATYRGLFRKDDDEAGVPDATVNAWHAELFPGGSVEHLALRQAFDVQKPRTTQITIRASSEGSEHQPLGFGGNDPNVAEMLTSESVQLTCHAPNHAMLIALSTLVMGSMMSGRKVFERAGHPGLEYGGSSDVGPEERAILPDDFGAFARTQTWRAIAHQTATVVSGLKDLPVLVNSIDVQNGGYDGGVSPL